VLKRLLEAPSEGDEKPGALTVHSQHGRLLVTVQTSNRQGVTLRLHAGSGASQDEVMHAVRNALVQLDDEGRGLQR
jgi:ParB family chromosome partitioning protein